MQAYHRFNKDCTDEEAAWIWAYCKRRDIDTGNLKFSADIDELY